MIKKRKEGNKTIVYNDNDILAHLNKIECFWSKDITPMECSEITGIDIELVNYIYEIWQDRFLKEGDRQTAWLKFNVLCPNCNRRTTISNEFKHKNMESNSIIVDLDILEHTILPNKCEHCGYEIDIMIECEVN